MDQITVSDNYKEVAFYKYCESCEYFELTPEDRKYREICDSCLDEPFRQYTETPLNWKRQE